MLQSSHSHSYPDKQVAVQNCADLKRDYFAQRSLIIAANRGPVVFRRSEDGQLHMSRGAGGLVTALTGLALQVNAIWIACGRTAEDIEWSQGKVQLGEEADNSLGIQFLNPDKEAYDGYYNSIANPLLWFLQHSMWDISRAPVVDRSTWQAWNEGYMAVNRLFAEAISASLKQETLPTLVMLQDYHLYLTARYIRQMLSARLRPTIMHFVHIPWPGPEYWRILPATMRQPILDSLCAVDMLGFQTMDDGLNFIRTCEAFLPKAHVNFSRGRVWFRNHATYVRDFPISIDVENLRQVADSQEAATYRKEIQEMAADRQLIVRVDRIEPSKNIIRGFQAFEEMLQHHPDHCGKVMFVAYLIPSRLMVEEYQDYLDELMAIAGRVNAHYGDSDWEPIRVVVGENYVRAVAAMQLYDVLLVNSIADGMNLVAKEGPIVNQRDGALILSERTGARQQLEPGATVIAPVDVYATGEAMHQALTMPREQRAEAANRLRWIVEREDINAWLCRQLETLNELDL